MGKKSKQRKSNNNKSPPCCYHGCSKKEFNNRGEHYKVLEDYERQLLDLDHNDKDVMVWLATIQSFFEQNKRVVSEPTFSRFVISHIADDYLKGKITDMLLQRLMFVIQIRYLLIPRHEGKDVDSPESESANKFKKCFRDVQTERGRINVIAREIPCDCMEEKRIEAKSMEKIAVCFSCEEHFSKEKMLRCKGCDYVQYCSTECSITHWPQHKPFCNGVSSAPTPEPLLSSFGEPSDVDAE